MATAARVSAGMKPGTGHEPQPSAASVWDGARVAVVGLGTENMPLLRFLVGRGARVVACDRKNPEELGPRLEELKRLGVAMALGPGYLDALMDVEVAFVSPGIPKRLPAIEAARRAGVRITGQTDLFLRLCRAPVVGITGSSGKTTTTTLTGLMLRASGRPVFVGGNIGEPLIEHLEEIGPDARVVLELSSFQLETTDTSPHGAVITNITPNHLDVHESMAAYVAAKERIVRFQGPHDFAVLNAEDDTVRAMAARTPGRVLWFALSGERRPGAWLDGGWLVADVADPSGEAWPREGAGAGSSSAEQGPGRGAVRLCHRSELRLRGLHNVANVLAASLAALSMGAPVEGVRETARSFSGVPHRLEEVARLDGVLYVNDSIATTPARSMAALTAFAEPVVLIAGGYDKHLPFDEWARLAVRRCRHVVLLGQTADAIHRALQEAVAELRGLEGEGEDGEAGPRSAGPTISRACSLEEAVAQARDAARPGDVVLLSPACASYDMFRNFEERGMRFRERVRALQAGEAADR